MINILRLIGFIFISVSIIIFGIQKKSVGPKIMGIGVIMASFNGV